MTVAFPRFFLAAAGVAAAALLAGCDDEVPAYLSVTPASATLSADVGGHDRVELVVHNGRRRAVDLAVPALPDDLAVDAAATTCGETLAAGASCRLALVFTPASAYVHTHRLVVNDEPDAGAAFTLTLDSEDVAWDGVRYIHDEGPAEGEAVTTDEAGNVYVAGLTRDLEPGVVTAVQGFYVTRFTRKGVREWSTYVHSVPGQLRWGADRIVAGGGQVCFLFPTWVGEAPDIDVFTTLQCLDAETGEGGWSQALGAGDENENVRSGLAMAANGDLLVADSQGPAATRTLHLYRYSAAGVPQWQRVVAAPVNVLGVAAATDGFVVAGNVQGDALGLALGADVSSGVVARFDAAGDLLWATEVGRVAVDDNVTAYGAAVDAADRVYASTWRTGNDVVDLEAEAIEQVRLAALASDGAPRWTATLPLTGVGGYSHDVAVSGDGTQVLVVGEVLGGTSTLDALPELVGYSTAGGMMAAWDAAGVLQWSTLLWTQEDGRVSLADAAFTPGGDVLVAGTTHDYHLDGSLLPAGIVPESAGETPRAGFVLRRERADAPE